MKEKMKKAIAIGLLLSMGTLAGCGGKSATNSKKMEVSIWSLTGSDYVEPKYADEDLVGKWLENKTNVSVENAYGNDGGLWGTKLSRLVAGNNLWNCQ